MSKRKCCVCGIMPSEYGLSLHRFPKNEAMRSRWKNFCNFSEIDDVSQLSICSRHFLEKDYNNPKALEYGGLLRLKTDAVPSVNISRKHKLRPTSVSMEAVIEPQPDTSKQIDMEIPVESENVQSDSDHEMQTPKRGEFENPRYPGDITTPDDSDHEMQTPKRREFENPRYPGDITPDVATPGKVKEAVFVLKDTIQRQRVTIKAMRERNRRLLKKVRSFQDFVEHLKSKNLISDEAGNALFVCIDKN